MALQKIILNVDGMSCSHCSATVQKTLEEIDGISNVSVDLEGENASFDAAGEGLIDKAIKGINEAGYQASSN